MKKPILLLFILLTFLITKKADAGTTYTWTGLGLNSNWTTAANWSPFTGYPGSGGSTTDIAVVNLSLLTINLTSNVTISQLQTTVFGITGVTINLSGASTVLTINNGITTAQPALFSIVLTFSGSGSALIYGTSVFGYAGSMAVTSGATAVFEPNSILDFASNQGSLNNAGTVKFLSGSDFKIGYNSSLTNSGTLTASSATFTMSGSPCSITNSGTFNATSSTFTLTGSTIPISNSGTFTTNKCTVTSNNSGCTFTNTSTFNDHGSTFTLTGQNNTFTNSGAASSFHGRGVTITFSGGNNGHSISNAGFFTADSSSAINMGTFNSQISNTGTVYAGVSNSPCIINLSAQKANINNSGTFYVGSTSGITLTGSQVAISTSAFFIFQSDAFGSGYLGSVPSTSVNLITGTYYIQRYISGGSAAYRGYRLFSSPVYASTISSNNVYNLNYIQSSALVTGTTGVAGGFDKTGNPSIYLYRENIAFSNATYISGNFRGVSSLTSAPTYTINGDAGNYNFPVGNGFLFWFRGDRTTNLANKYNPGTSAESVVMTATGTLNVGQVTVHDWYTPASANLGYTATAGNNAVRGDNLVGNPYPSSIDWETFQSTTTTTGIYGSKVGPSIYELNPLNQNYGAYIKGGGGVGTNNATNIIASGQGFFVIDSAATAKLIFNETAKSTSQATSPGLMMAVHATNLASITNPYLRLQMGKDTANLDDMLLRFNNSAKMNYDQNEDAPYKQGFGKASLSSVSGDNVALAINTMPYPKNGARIPLVVKASQDTIYNLRLKTINQLPQLFDIWLMDAYKKDSLNIREHPVYNFNLKNSDSASYGSGRFSLVIRPNPFYAFKLLDFNANKATVGALVNVTWSTQNEGNYTYFTVERSTDNGTTYQAIGNAPSTGQGTYTLPDNTPINGMNLYRLKQIDVYDSVSYSKVVEVLYSNQAGGLAGNLNVYPNPAANTLNLVITKSSDAANYDITIANSAGVTVKHVTTTQPYWQDSVSSLIPGTYMIRVVNDKDKSLVGDARFVKL